MLMLSQILLLAFIGQNVNLPIPRVGDQEMKKRIILAVYAYYPEEAKGQNVPDKVLVEIVVNKEGKVEAAKVVQGHPILDDAATHYVRIWKFKPSGAKYSGRVFVSFTWKMIKAEEGQSRVIRDTADTVVHLTDWGSYNGLTVHHHLVVL